MPDEMTFPSTGYISDAAVNNAEIVFGSERANMAALIDLINILQCAVINECLVVSPMALKRSSLLKELDFADCFRISEEGSGDDKTIRISSPLTFPESNSQILIDVDENGELSTNSAQGELCLATAWSETLQDDDILGSLVIPERLSDDQPRDDAYIAKFAAFMLWLQTDRRVARFEDDGAREMMTQAAEDHLRLYRQLTRRLVSCRDLCGLDLTCSVIEEPIFSLSVGQEVNEPLEYLEQFDSTVQKGIIATRSKAFERWNLPAIGAAVLGKCERLDDLPKEIGIAREKLLKARSEIKRRNRELVAFEREMELGNDTHFMELDELKVLLQRSLRAFGEDTEYQEDLESFPVSDRIWWLPKILATALGAMKSPEKALADIAALPWLRRQSFLRYVPGMRDASSYIKNARTPVMTRIIQDIGRIDWDRAETQCRTLDWASDFIRRSCDLRDPEKIGNKELFTIGDDQSGETAASVKEDTFWLMMASNRAMRDAFFHGTDEKPEPPNS